MFPTRSQNMTAFFDIECQLTSELLVKIIRGHTEKYNFLITVQIDERDGSLGRSTQFHIDVLGKERTDYLRRLLTVCDDQKRLSRLFFRLRFCNPIRRYLNARQSRFSKDENQNNRDKHVQHYGSRFMESPTFLPRDE
ncbi:MAG: hypothetical protein IKZ41_03755 [Clostridia bacterium]|nr:hypothetical protein [Clostridia bacterium]